MNRPQRRYDTGGTIKKIDLINGAYSKLRISGLTVSPTPEDIEVALMYLESMAAEWFSRNMEAGYNFEDDPDPDCITNIPTSARQAYEYGLAMRLISDFNKQPPQAFFAMASSSITNLASQEALTREVDYPGRQPRGSGQRRWNPWQRYYQPQDQAALSNQSNVLYEGNVNDYVEHFDSYLNDGEFISSFTIETDSGLAVISSANNSPDINYTLRADNTGTQRVKINVTTSDSRKTTRVAEYEVIKVQLDA